eukprot:gene15939-biopygen3724
MVICLGHGRGGLGREKWWSCPPPWQESASFGVGTVHLASYPVGSNPGGSVPVGLGWLKSLVAHEHWWWCGITARSHAALARLSDQEGGRERRRSASGPRAVRARFRLSQTAAARTGDGRGA